MRIPVESQASRSSLIICKSPMMGRALCRTSFLTSDFADGALGPHHKLQLRFSEASTKSPYPWYKEQAMVVQKQREQISKLRPPTLVSMSIRKSWTQWTLYRMDLGRLAHLSLARLLG